MFTHRPLLDERDDQKVADRQTAGLVGIAVTLVLLVLGLFLVQQLQSPAAFEDCVMSGRTNCNPLGSSPR